MLSLTPSPTRLGVLLCGLALFWQTAVAAPAPGCAPSPELRSARIAEVVDGDTLRLQDGTLVRLVGINTPELGRDGRPDQALAVAAQRALKQWLGHSKVLLQPAAEREDRHGRLLVSVFRGDDRRHAGEYLLRRGLGWQVVVPPNITHVECLRAAENTARRERRGVWSRVEYAAAPVAALSPGEGGFRRLKGRVTRVAESRSAYWLEFGDQLSVRIARTDLAHFPNVDWTGLEGKELTLRGWLIYRGKQKRGYPPHLMHLRHPVMLETIND